MTLCPPLNTVLQHNSGFYQATTGCKCTGGELLFDIIGPSHSFLFIAVGSGLRKGNRVPQCLRFAVVSLKETEQYQNLLVIYATWINLESNSRDTKNTDLDIYHLTNLWKSEVDTRHCHVATSISNPPFLRGKVLQRETDPRSWFNWNEQKLTWSQGSIGGRSDLAPTRLAHGGWICLGGQWLKLQLFGEEVIYWLCRKWWARKEKLHNERHKTKKRTVILS